MWFNLDGCFILYFIKIERIIMILLVEIIFDILDVMCFIGEKLGCV